MKKGFLVVGGVAAALLAVAVWRGSSPVARAAAPVLAHALNAADDSPRDPAFAALRQSFLGALKRGDWGYLAAASHPAVAFGQREKSFKTPKAKKEFLALLQKGLGAGCALAPVPEAPRQQQFVCPFVAARWPAGVDSNTHVAVVTRANLRQAPQPEGVKLGVLGVGVYPLCAVRRAGPDTSRLGGYVCVSTPQHKQGFVHGANVLGRDEVKLVFRRHGAGWRLAGLKP